MKLRLFYNLKKEQRVLSARPEFKKDLWNKLEARLDVSAPLPWYRRPALEIAMAGGMLGFIFLGTGVYAYTSPYVTEGTPLYPVKIGLENIEEKTKLTTESKVEFYLKKAERRDEEKVVIIKKQPATVASSTAPVKQKEIQKTPVQKTEQAISQLETKLEKIKAKLNTSTEDNALRAAIDKRLSERGRGKANGRNKYEDSNNAEFNTSTDASPSTQDNNRSNGKVESIKIRFQKETGDRYYNSSEPESGDSRHRFRDD